MKPSHQVVRNTNRLDREDNCYALALARRLKAMGSAKYQHDGDPRTSGPGFGLAIHPQALRQPYTWGGPRVVFVNSMSDLSDGVMILKSESSQVNRYKCTLWHVRRVSRTGGAGR
jgi:protein gp37